MCIFYTVRAFGEAWTCDCPDFLNRCAEIDACKHIHATRFWVAAKTELRNEPKPRVFAEDALQCGMCGSIRIKGPCVNWNSSAIEYPTTRGVEYSDI